MKFNDGVKSDDAGRTVSFSDVLFDPRWEYCNAETGFRYRLGCIPGQLLFVSIHGAFSDEEDIARSAVLARAVIDENRLVGIPYILTDFTAFAPLRSLRIRQQFAREIRKGIHDTGNSRALRIVIKPDRFNRTIIRVFSPFLMTRIVVVESIEEAFEQINSRPPRQVQRCDVPNEISVSAANLEEISHAIGVIQWDETAAFPSAPVSPDNPLAFIAEALELVRQDLDEMRSNERKNLRFQEIVSEISSAFIITGEDAFDADMNRMLERLGNHFAVDRTSLFLFSDDRRFLFNTHEWCADGVLSQRHLLQTLETASIPWWVEQVEQKKGIHFADIHLLPDCARLEREQLASQGIQSVLAITVASAGRIWGFLGFDAVKHPYRWSDKEIDNLSVVANIVADLLLKRLNERLLKEAKELAEMASRAKSSFLAHMSHEIRTPLNAVIGFADLLKDTPLSAVQRQYVDNSAESGRTLMRIINDILDFSKIEADMMRLENLRTDLPELLAHSMDVVRFAAAKKNLALRLSVDDAMPRSVMVDSVRLKQVLGNLLSNAIKFTGTGEVALTVEFAPSGAQQGQLSFAVRDTGIGIADEQRDRLFKAFSQADDSTTRRFGGTGLGLIISQMIVQKMGGSITFDSAEGQGAVFRFSLPVSLACDDAPPVDAGEPPVTASGCQLRPVTVLIAEDVHMNRTMLKAFLRRLLPRAELIEVPDGAQAVARCRVAMPDLIFMDVHMPQMNGLDATVAIRQLEAASGGHVPIVALTAGAYAEEREKCMAAGMDVFLSKPLNAAEMTGVVHRFLHADAPDAPVPFDRQQLLLHLGGNVRLVDELLDLAREDVPRTLAAIRAALDSADRDAIRRQAHALKGMALNMAFSQLAALARALEQGAAANDSQSDLWRCFDDMTAAWHRLEESLKIDISASV